METKKVYLHTEKELRAYMHSTRQKILHYLSLAPDGMTAKQLADRLAITPSSAGHHLSTLESIGMVKMIRTEKIHGLTAKYYKEVQATVSLKDTVPAAQEIKNAMLQNLINDIYSRWNQAAIKIESEGREPAASDGNLLTGIIYLTPEEAEEMGNRLLDFFERHEQPKEGCLPYEYALIAYNTKILEK